MKSTVGLFLICFALLAACGDDEPAAQPSSKAVVHLFGRPDWEVEREAEKVLGTEELELLRGALDVSKENSGSSVWIVDEPIPFWMRDRVKPSVDSSDSFIWRLRTKYPIDPQALSRQADAAVIRFPGVKLQRGDSATALSSLQFMVTDEGGFVALPGTTQESAEGVTITYPARAEPSVGHLRPLVGQGHSAGTPRAISLDPWEHDTRRTILLAPPGAIRTRVNLAESASLHFGIGLRRQGWRASSLGLESCESGSDGVGFRLTVRVRPGEEEVAWEHFLTLAEADRFHDITVDLNRWHNSAVDLIFSTFGSNFDTKGKANIKHDFAFIAEPIVVTERPLPRTHRGKGRPNIVLILIDTLREDALGCYGAPPDRSPALDRLAREGVQFVRARASNSWTLPSHSSIFTSLLPNEHNTLLSTDRLSDRFLVFPEVLQAAGWTTVAYTGAGYVHPRFGLGQGFDRFIARDETVGEKEKDVLAWLRTNDAPFFLFFHTYEVHSPYAPPEPFLSRFSPEYHGEFSGKVAHAELEAYWQKLGGKPIPADALAYLKGLYAAEVAYTDQVIGNFLNELRSMGLWDDTLVIVMSDHGEEWWEHGDHNHGGTLYEEVLRVPLIIRFPGLFEGGRKVDQPVRLIDVAPTILEVAGIQSPDAWTGISLTDLEAPRDFLATIAYKYNDAELKGTRAYAVLGGTRKFIQAPRGFYRTNGSIGSQLFDLAQDPHERDDILREAEEPRYVKAVGNLVRRHAVKLEGDAEKAQLSGEAEAFLRSIGYLGGRQK